MTITASRSIPISSYSPASVTRPARQSSSSQQMKASRAADDKVSISDTAKASVRSKDFTNMTPYAFSKAAQNMYDKGRISLDQLFKMQMAAGGIPGSPGAPQPGDHKPVNYIKYFQVQLAGIESRGRANDPRSGYNDVVRILNVLS